jgi:UrcA family protein
MRTFAAILALASAGATLTASTVTAFAEESRQVIVQISDLDLAAPAGQATLDGRVRAAARKVCGPLPRPVQLGELMQVRECHRGVFAQAREKLTGTPSSGAILRTR